MADEDAVLSDVEGDDDPVPIILPPVNHAASASSSAAAAAAAEQRIRDLTRELEEERRARKSAEDSCSDLQNKFSRLRDLAREAIKKRDEAFRERDEAARARDEAVAAAERAAAEVAEATRLRDEDSRQKDALRSEMDAASQMLVSGIEKISGKVSAYKNFSAGGNGLPKSQKYTGMPAVAYSVIKRSSEIADELMKQIDSVSKSRDQAREQVEQRNYEIAIEVSQLEATISGLREEGSKKSTEIESLQKTVAESEGKILELESKITDLTQFGEEQDSKVKSLEMKLDSQRPLIIDQLNYISKAYEQIRDILRAVADTESDQSDSSDSLFIWNEIDIDSNLNTSLDGSKSVYELAKVAADKVRSIIHEKSEEVKSSNEQIAELLAEKQHIGTLLRSSLSSRTNEVRQVAEDGLREAGIDLKLDANFKRDFANDHENEVYVLAGALESSLKEYHIKIIELQHLVEALRAESSLLKSRLDAQAKEINQQKRHIKELEEKERLANENVEGLMMDISAAEEEIARWKAAAEQEAAAGRAVEQEFQIQLSAIQKELEVAKQALVESENKLKFKEETAAAAMAARDAAEKSLRLADVRSSRLRERLEQLTRQLEESEIRADTRNLNSYRYVCWPWQWLGLNPVRYQQTEIEPNNNEMELSEPLL